MDDGIGRTLAALREQKLEQDTLVIFPFYWRLGGMMAIRKGEWKLVKTREGPFVDADPGVLSDLSGAELYNLAEDIGDTKNLAAVRRDKFKELSEAWQRWNTQLAKPLWDAPRQGRGPGMP